MDLSALQEQLVPEAQNTLFHPSEGELHKVVDLILKNISEVNPARVALRSRTRPYQVRALIESQQKAL